MNSCLELGQFFPKLVVCFPITPMHILIVIMSRVDSNVKEYIVYDEHFALRSIRPRFYVGWDICETKPTGASCADWLSHRSWQPLLILPYNTAFRDSRFNGFTLYVIEFHHTILLLLCCDITTGDLRDNDSRDNCPYSPGDIDLERLPPIFIQH